MLLKMVLNLLPLLPVPRYRHAVLITIRVEETNPPAGQICVTAPRPWNQPARAGKRGGGNPTAASVRVHRCKTRLVQERRRASRKECAAWVESGDGPSRESVR
jgi:hypothetical protein